MIGRLVLFLGLTLLSFYDLKKQQLPVWLLTVLGGIAVCFLVLKQIGLCLTPVTVTPLALFASVLPGAGMIAIAFGSREKIGLGDGLAVCITGVFLGYKENLLLIALAFVGCGLVSLWVICVRKGSRNTRISFVPFLLLADLALLW